MDWAKTKTIFIVVFLLLNLFLLSTIIYTNSDIRFQSDYISYAKEYLESRNIKIDSRVQDKKGEVGILNYAAKRIDFSRLTRYVFGHEVSQSKDDGVIVYEENGEKTRLMGDELFIRDKLDNGVALFHDRKAFSQKVYNILSQIGYNRTNLNLQSNDELDDEKTMVFILEYKNELLFDQVITASIDQEGFLTLTLPTREVKRMINASKDEIISAYQVLVMGTLPDGTHIKSVDFGYKQSGEGELYDSPVWRILLVNGDTFYYNAYTGEKLKEKWS